MNEGTRPSLAHTVFPQQRSRPLTNVFNQAVTVSVYAVGATNNRRIPAGLDDTSDRLKISQGGGAALPGAAAGSVEAQAVGPERMIGGVLVGKERRLFRGGERGEGGP